MAWFAVLKASVAPWPPTLAITGMLCSAAYPTYRFSAIKRPTRVLISQIVLTYSLLDVCSTATRTTTDMLGALNSLHLLVRLAKVVPPGRIMNACGESKGRISSTMFILSAVAGSGSGDALGRILIGTR